MSLSMSVAVAKKTSPEDPGPPRRRGRPKQGGRLPGRVVLTCSPEYLVWVDEFLDHVGELNAAGLMREAIRRWAKDAKFRDPPKI